MNKVIEEWKKARCSVCNQEIDFVSYVFSLYDGKSICMQCVRKRHLEVTGS
jgi:recombinational DNA repair protein (RecF pathway)